MTNPRPLQALAAVLLLASGPGTTATPEVTFVAAPDGVPLCVAEGGNPQGPVIVLIHGFSQTYAVFARQFAPPLTDEFRLIAPDMRGHGCSGKPWAEGAYDGARPWADDIAAVLRAKQVTRAVMVGWSAGGFWLTDYIRVHGSDAVAGWVLVGSAGGMSPPPTDPAGLARLEAMRAANRNYTAAVPESIEKAEDFAKLMSAQPLPEDIRRVMAAGPVMLPAYARRAMSVRTMENPDIVERIRVPTLFIVGDEDRIANPAVVKTVADRIPGAEYLAYPGTGHSAFAEQPARFNRDVADFARRVHAAVAP
jgi:pimeloyl-ACP methyl ester carboxylesterase